MGTEEVITWSSLVFAVITLIAALVAFRQAMGAIFKRAWLFLGLACLAASLAGGALFYSSGIAPIPQLYLAAVAAGLLCSLLLVAGFLDLSRQLKQKHTAGEALQSELDLLRHGFDNASEMLVIKDEKGSYLAANQAYAAFLGKTIETILGRADYDFFPRSLANNIRQEEERLLAGGAAKSGKEELRGAAGLRSLLTHRTALRNKNGEIFATLLAAQDITELSQDTAQLSGEIRALSELLEAITMLVGAGFELELYKTILEAASRLAGSEHTCLWLVDEVSKSLVARAGTGRFQEIRDLRIKPGEDLPGRAWQTNQEVFSADYPTWNKRHPALSKLGFLSAAAVPVKAETQILGVLSIYFEAETREFSRTTFSHLGRFADAVALALEKSQHSAARARELEERNQTLAQYQYRLRLERLVAAIAARFIQIDPAKVDDAITRSLQSVAKFAGVDKVYILLLPSDDAQRMLKAGSYCSQPDTALNASNYLDSQESQWLIGRLNQLETIQIHRRLEHQSDPEEAGAFLQARGLALFTALPMVANRSLIGYLGLESKTREQEWPAEVLALFKICAEMYVSVLERKWSAEELQARMQKSDQDKASIERRAQESALIAEMGDLLQACRTADEAYPIIARYASRLLPQLSGALYLVRHAADPAENVVSWGESPPAAGERELGPNECWGLRRGRLHAVLVPDSEPMCAHVHEPYPSSYLCVPLIAQGASAGVLHLRQNESQAVADPLSPDHQLLATRVAEYIALALTNLNLRDTLRSQAIRDPLTGLFNRRYMEETLEREIRRANRHGTSVGIIMFDIDRMKPINDTYGHDAGDLLLRTLGEVMISSFRGEDVACRYGGDEFTIVLPEASLLDVWRRAEQLRESVKKMDVKYEGRSVGAITLSIGVAAYPDHGLTAERVLLAADAASYASKSEGGDRIMVGHEAEG